MVHERASKNTWQTRSFRDFPAILFRKLFAQTYTGVDSTRRVSNTVLVHYTTGWLLSNVEPPIEIRKTHFKVFDNLSPTTHGVKAKLDTVPIVWRDWTWPVGLYWIAMAPTETKRCVLLRVKQLKLGKRQVKVGRIRASLSLCTLFSHCLVFVKNRLMVEFETSVPERCRRFLR